MSWTKAWQDFRPGWTRRVRWYPQRSGLIRLQFEERRPGATVREKHSVTVSLEEAHRWYNEYIGDFKTITGRDIFFHVKEQEEMDDGDQ